MLASISAGVVVELSADYAVVLGPGDAYAVAAREDRALATHLQSATSVLIDTPAGVAPLSPALTSELRKLTIPIAYSDRDRLHDVALGGLPRPARRSPMSRRAGAVLAGVALTLAAAGGGWAAQAVSDRPPVDASRLLVEGRVAVSVPASWTVERVTTGPGSARVRVSAVGGLPALHITQADGGPATLADVTESLSRAIGSEEPEVFTDFDPTGERAGRAAATYVERRTDSQTRWSVLIDGTLRIAIGCQSAPDRASTVGAVCDEAVRSARAVR
ncbi:type VII secretion-associated protein [Mycobacterium sp. ITM-2016-00317]|uniref:type VII secretion-associated protein n=1 Tax=Mycobacterium sp. ITM-2016-00317 TaxID=2099694 RepID=UPI00287F8FB1|nr:type VII secretion-associated protein [Mycobacterium sp. ITM-2016-00317]WNG88757.1 type VII secretion-associated protein [Mycobacterium sp. ITM-2016-00317]